MAGFEPEKITCKRHSDSNGRPKKFHEKMLIFAPKKLILCVELKEDDLVSRKKSGIFVLKRFIKMRRTENDVVSRTKSGISAPKRSK